MHDKRLSLIVLLGGSSGCSRGFGLQIWVSAIAYPLNIGGRPLISWPHVHPGDVRDDDPLRRVLGRARHARLNGLPMPYHPVFNVARFGTPARTGSSWLIEATDPKFDRAAHAASSSRVSEPSEINDVEDRKRAMARRMRRGSRRCASARALLAGCRQDMHDQPKYRAARARARSSRTASARGRSSRARSRAARCRGRCSSSPARSNGEVDAVPFAVDRRVLDRGEQRFDIYCTPCHGRTGDGNGMVVQRGFKQPPSYHIDRLRQAAGRALLRRDHQRLRRDAGLQGADRAARPLGDRRLHPRAAAQPARDRRRRAGRTSRRSCSRRPAASGARGRSTRTHMDDTRTDDHRRRRHRAAAAAGRWSSASSGCCRRDRRVPQPDAVLAVVADRLPLLDGPPCGSLALLMMQHLTGGQWGLVAPARLRSGDAARCRCARCSSSRSLLGMPQLYRVGAAGRGRRRRRDPEEGAVPERAVLRRSARSSFSPSGRLLVAAEQLVGRPGPRRVAVHPSGHADASASSAPPGSLIYVAAR